MPWVGFEPTIPAFERAKTVHALDRAVTVIGIHCNNFLLICVGLSCRFFCWQNTDGLWAGWPGFDSWQGEHIFIFSVQPPIQWVPGVKRAAAWNWPLTSILRLRMFRVSTVVHTSLVVFLDRSRVRVHLQTVRLHGREISPSQGRYLHTEEHKQRINAHRQPCFKWDWNQRSQCLSGWRRFMPYTARPLWRADFKDGKSLSLKTYRISVKHRVMELVNEL
jgi:hypothetical protein